MEMKQKIEKLRKKGRLTKEQVKGYKIFEGVNDEQAQEIVDSIRKFVIIFFDHYHTVKKKEEEKEFIEE